MKKILLSAALSVATFGFSQTYDNTGTYLINELIASPPNGDDVFVNDIANLLDSPIASLDNVTYEVDNALEYFEFRGAPGTAIPANTYFIAIDGEGSDNGEINDVIDLGGLEFGTNGLLVMVANAVFNEAQTGTDVGFAAPLAEVRDVTIPAGTRFDNPYFPSIAVSETGILSASGANVIVYDLPVTGIGFRDENDDAVGGAAMNSFSTTRDTRGYDGTIEDQGVTFMLISATGDNIPVRGDDVDTADDGVLEGKALNWTIYDSVSVQDDSGGIAYGQVVFHRSSDPITANLQNVTQVLVALNQDPQWYGRQGNLTGYAATADQVDNDDWFAARINSNSFPEWNLSSNVERLLPQDMRDTFTSVPASTFGGENPNFGATASVDDVLLSKFSVYPNPAKGRVSIQSADLDLTSVQIYNMLGKEVYASKETSSIDVSSFAKGMYLLKLNTEDASATKKLIVE